ncbi:platelet factor 4 [Nannospalax galili]|uniref:Multifunctional fusion protein n=1 Tax=Nannospalax galili TaxID=1026970 RepID=A0A8C6RJ02_NANGA|nr:platelet factor 4 [Nannospalax galili]
MSLPAMSGGPRPWPGLGLLLLGLLILTAMVASSVANPEESNDDLNCVCVKTTSSVHLKRITSLEVIKAGRHCAVPQLIATLKNGRKICLDPQTPLHKKIMKKLLES